MEEKKKTKKQLAAEAKRRKGTKLYWAKWREEHHDELVAKHRHNCGRHKKRGPKKKRYKPKPKPVEKKPRKTFEFKIMITQSRKQTEYVGKYHNLEEVNEAMARLKTENDDKVVIERQLNNSGRGEKAFEDSYVIIEKNHTQDLSPMYFRNEYGKMVEHRINTRKWRIYDIVPRKVEEEFWVYGYDPAKERKTFPWIYENILLGRIETQYDIKRVLLYNNKVLIKDDYESYEMIICKTISDAIRVYNKMQEWVKKNKQKQIYFIGDYSPLSDRRRALEDDIAKMTGWNKRKIQRKKT